MEGITRSPTDSQTHALAHTHTSKCTRTRARSRRLHCTCACTHVSYLHTPVAPRSEPARDSAPGKPVPREEDSGLLTCTYLRYNTCRGPVTAKFFARNPWHRLSLQLIGSSSGLFPSQDIHVTVLQLRGIHQIPRRARAVELLFKKPPISCTTIRNWVTSYMRP